MKTKKKMLEVDVYVCENCGTEYNSEEDGKFFNMCAICGVEMCDRCQREVFNMTVYDNTNLGGAFVYLRDILTQHSIYYLCPKCIKKTKDFLNQVDSDLKELEEKWIKKLKERV